MFPIIPLVRTLFRLILFTSAIAFVASQCAAQTQNSDTPFQFWPRLNVSFELTARARITGIVEKHNGEDDFYKQEKVGAAFSHRWKRIGRQRKGENDKENEFTLVSGSDYYFIRTDQNGSTKHEHRIALQATPKYIIGPEILLQDRNQIEFRWINGVYDFRYRNKLTVDRPFKIQKVHFTPYASGELFWDRNNHSWNENQYAFGVRLPYKKTWMLDLFYLHQNCTTCSLDPVNVFGTTLNLYFDWLKH